MIHERQARQAEPLTAATRGEGPACCLADTWVTPPTTPLPPALENSPVCLHLDPAAQLGLGPSHGWGQSWERGGNAGEAWSRKDLAPALEQHCCAEAAEGQGPWRIHAAPEGKGTRPAGQGK